MQSTVWYPTVTKDYINFEKWRLISVTFCLVCCFKCCEVCEMKLQLIVLTTNGTYGSGSLANSLGRASELHVCALLPQQQAAVDSSLSFKCIVFTNSKQSSNKNRQQVADKSTQKKICRCQRLLLLYSK